MLQALAGQLLYADVHGVPFNPVLCLVLAAGERQPKVLVVVQDIRVISYVVNVIQNRTLHHQQQKAALIIWQRYKTFAICKRARTVLAPAIMHWALRPGGPLQRLHAAKATIEFGTLCPP